MKEVIVRTNFNEKIGLGHLFRTKALVKNFKEKNFKITFALDNEIQNKKLLNYNYFNLYSPKEKFVSQSKDAFILKKKIQGKNIKYIIVDDYRLNKNWEKHFYNKGIKLIVFEDVNDRKHLCDFIIDSRPIKYEILEKKYTKLLPKKCKKLLGPKFSIVNSNFKNKNNKSSKLNILFYFGGGGDFKNYYNLIYSFSSIVKNSKLSHKININIVIGPLAKNYQDIKILSKKNKFIKIIHNKLNLSPILEKTSLFFGTASSIVNELNYLKIPACLFSTSKNQNQNLKYRENFGQYLFFEKNELIKSDLIANLIITLINNFVRIKNLCNEKTFQVDKYGAKRIINEISGSKSVLKKNIGKFQKDKKKNGIFPVSDNLINEYLYSRNLIKNRKNSVNTNLINKIEHYIWWFTTKKKSFYLLRDGKIRLFLSQELTQFKNKKFWLGGWFNAKDQCTVLDIMKALKWQLRYSKKQKNSTWIVLIKKSNKIVFKINKYLGYKIISPKNNKIEYQAIKSFYKIKNPANFYFLKK